MSEVVELHQAFSWDCPECGRENFERAIQAEVTGDDLRESIARQTGMKGFEIPEDMLDEGAWLMAPKSVKCPHCDHHFRARAIGERPFDDEEDEPDQKGE